MATVVVVLAVPATALWSSTPVATTVMAASVVKGSTSEMAPTKVVFPTPNPPAMTNLNRGYVAVRWFIREHGHVQSSSLGRRVRPRRGLSGGSGWLPCPEGPPQGSPLPGSAGAYKLKARQSISAVRRGTGPCAALSSWPTWPGRLRSPRAFPAQVGPRRRGTAARQMNGRMSPSGFGVSCMVTRAFRP